ncbi:putative pilus (MSHA type) biogenesis protein MshL [Magnetofaba australis IT-1]|uniref:Putative pilus (MSHA type) biogenesis protein MshL n=2 Tax=Magnetofaba TaxID=1472292 RepID=A0A1Y2K5P7_9PROT|nr:putative pilus (MSHA type) biogenesis protein MshL [Magnetofaba australis IT-1]
MMKDSESFAAKQAALSKDMSVILGTPPDRDIHKLFVEESENFRARQDELFRDLNKSEYVPPVIEPVPPTHNPLQDINVSLEMDKEDVRHVLQALAKMTDMNLLIHPRVLKDPPYISVSFRNVDAATVFKEILELADLHGVIQDNVLRVDLYQEATLDLGFLETQITSSFSVGGDVLGSANAGDASGGQLTGSFNLNGQAGSVTNPYDAIETVVTNVMSTSGDTGGGQSVSVNRMTGTMFLRARPSAVRNITKLVDRYKEVLGRQVLIETRVMEVTLSDQYRAGVDWYFLRNNLATSRGVSMTIPQPWETATTVGTTTQVADTDLNFGSKGQINSEVNFASLSIPAITSNPAGLALAIGGKYGLAAVDLLKQFGDVQVLSNPSVRARHGMPAMISVGTSKAYVSETTVTTTGGTTTTTDYEVTTNTVFDGLMIGVVPFIRDDGKIQLTINPIKSDVSAASLELTTIGTTQLSLPQVDLKEMSTVLEVNNKDTVLLGGLIDKYKATTKTGVPVLSELPIIGRAFSTDSESESTRELVIMIRATIL